MMELEVVRHPIWCLTIGLAKSKQGEFHEHLPFAGRVLRRRLGRTTNASPILIQVQDKAESMVVEDP